MLNQRVRESHNETGRGLGHLQSDLLLMDEKNL
jgi:hypothetical protein